jgi:hypothetical protein
MEPMRTHQKNVAVAEIAKDCNTLEVDTLIREYKQTRWVPNSKQIGKPDSLSAWYSIEDMENFLAEAKSNGGDGFKIYFGAYPKNYESKPEYAGRQTLVMVPTKSKISESGVVANKDIYVLRNGQIQLGHGLGPGNICPPTCNPGSEGGMGDLGITIVDKGEEGMEIV